jgi:hypothetical protein
VRVQQAQSRRERLARNPVSDRGGHLSRDCRAAAGFAVPLRDCRAAAWACVCVRVCMTCAVASRVCAQSDLRHTFDGLRRRSNRPCTDHCAHRPIFLGYAGLLLLLTASSILLWPSRCSRSSSAVLRVHVRSYTVVRSILLRQSPSGACSAHMRAHNGHVAHTRRHTHTLCGQAHARILWAIHRAGRSARATLSSRTRPCLKKW